MNHKKTTQIIIRPLGAMVILGAIGALTAIALRPQTVVARKEKVAAARGTAATGGAARPVPIATKTVATPAASGAASLLTNGSMEQGTELSPDWPFLWVGTGNARIQRDPVTVHSGKAALRLESENGKIAHASASQPIDISQGRTIRIKGYARSRGTFQLASIAVQTFKDENGQRKQTGWIDLVDLKNAHSGWHGFDKTVTVPAEATYVQTTISLHGDGKIWLDDIEAFPVSKP